MKQEWISVYQAAMSSQDPRHRLSLLQEGEISCASEEEPLFIFRLSIATCALDTDQPELGMRSLFWCLQTFDKNPNLSRHLRWLLHILSWTANAFQEYPEVTLAQRDELLAEYKKRLLQAGYQPRAYVETCSIAASYAGALKDALELRLRAGKMQKDQMCNDIAIETNCLVYIYYQMGEWEATLRAAEPIMNGSVKNDVVPGWTYPMVAKAYFKLGDRNKGLEYTDLGVGALQSRGSLGATSELIENYGLMGHVTPGIDLLERRYEVSRIGRPLEKFRFYASAAILLKAALIGDPNLEIRFDPKFLEDHKIPNNRADTILDTFSKEVRSLAEAFNQRNGNTHWTDYFGLKL